MNVDKSINCLKNNIVKLNRLKMPPLNKMKNKPVWPKKKNIIINNDPIFSNKGAKTKQELIDKIDTLSENQFLNASKLLDTMVYPDGNHKGEILSPYLQKKAIDLVLSTREKPESSALEIKNKMDLLKKENNRLTKQIGFIASKYKSLAKM